MTEEATTTKKQRASEHVTKAVLRAVRETPGVTSSELAEELSLHQSTISVATAELETRCLITRVRKGRHHLYYPAGAQDVTVAPITATDIEVEALKAEVVDLRREVEELRAFKARAVFTHPELDTDPIVLEARKIGYRALFDAGNRDGADNVLLGDADNSAFVLAIVEALRSGAKRAES